MDLLKSISLALALAVVSLSVSPTVRPSGALWAQMHMPHPTSGPEAPLGIPETRLGSGTSWLPDSSPMHASHFTLGARSEEHTSELQSRGHLVCRLLLEKKKIK